MKYGAKSEKSLNEPSRQQLRYLARQSGKPIRTNNHVTYSKLADKQNKRTGIIGAKGSADRRVITLCDGQLYHVTKGYRS